MTLKKIKTWLKNTLSKRKNTKDLNKIEVYDDIPYNVILGVLNNKKKSQGVIDALELYSNRFAATMQNSVDLIKVPIIDFSSPEGNFDVVYVDKKTINEEVNKSNSDKKVSLRDCAKEIIEKYWENKASEKDIELISGIIEKYLKNKDL